MYEAQSAMFKINSGIATIDVPELISCMLEV